MTPSLLEQLDQFGDIIQLHPQIVARFYRDANRLGQRPANAPQPPHYQPERWIGSSTQAVNPPGLPAGGLSTCAGLSRPTTLRDLLAHPQAGPRLLGEKRFQAHQGSFRVLIKLLDSYYPIPYHVHADDRFVSAHPKVYPGERFGKDEAYHFLSAPKGLCPYTHLGVYPGVTLAEVVAASLRSTDALLELSPAAYQNYDEGFLVQAGLLHRPGSALTLEIQQPSDVYAFAQRDLGGVPLDPAVLSPGFAGFTQALEQVVNWKDNQNPKLLEAARLKPQPAMVPGLTSGAKVDWIFPPEASAKFSGLRLCVETEMTFRFSEPCVLYVWCGQGTLAGRAIDGGQGRAGQADEFFLGAAAVNRGLELKNTGDGPLHAFALFAASL